MTLTGLVDLFCSEPTIVETVADARARRLPVLDVTAPATMRPMIAAALSVSAERGGAGRPVLLISSTFREAEELTAALQSLVGEQAVAYYPAWETLPHERLSPRSDTVGRRLDLLRRLAGNSDVPAPQIVVAPVRSVLQPQVKGLGELKPIRLAVGTEIDLMDLASALVGAAYTRVDLVERRGEFAVRGGIVDVFPPTEEHPVRIDFFGDTVEELRYFSVADQRSSDFAVDEIIASPCRELLLTDEVRARAAALAEQHPELIEMLDKIAQGHPVDGMEALSPALVDGMELLIDLLPADTHVLVCDPELVRGRAIELVKTSAGVPPCLVGRGCRRWQSADRPGRLGLPAACGGTFGGTWARAGVVDVVTLQRRASGRLCDRRRAVQPHPDRGGRDHRSLGSGRGAWCRVANGVRPGRRDLSWRHRGSSQRDHQAGA